MKPEELTHKIAIYQHTKFGMCVATGNAMDSHDDYVRVSDFQTVTFQPRAASEVMAAAVAAIDAQILTAQQNVRQLEQRKAELLALPAPEAV